jgi:hypothetical protein
MSIPSSGRISFNDLRVELGVPSQAPFKLGEAERGTYATINPNSNVVNADPARISEFYGYTQDTTITNVGTTFYTLT